MVESLLVVIISLAILVWSADKFIDGAASIAAQLNVSGLVIGLVILGFGTSAPEIIVSIFAALDGNPELALGNAIGSNVANISMVLGTTALIFPVVVESATIRKEFLILLTITAICYFLLYDFYLSRLDSIILLSLLVLVLIWMIKGGIDDRQDALTKEIEREPQVYPFKTMPQAVLWLSVGLALLLASSKGVVWGASNIAHILGVSDLIIGLTIVAIGTSLPELAASMVAALRREHDMAIGNILGSNLFNLLAVIGVSGLIRPYSIPTIALNRDYLIMSAFTIVLFFLIFRLKNKTCTIARWQGGLLLAGFVSYMLVLAFYNPEVL